MGVYMSRIVIFLAAALVLAATVAAGPAATKTPEKGPDPSRLLALRVAQADGYQRLADRVLEEPLPDGKTVAAALGLGSDKEIALRMLLRSARMIGDPRVYSDGVTEVDLEISLDAVMQKLRELLGSPGSPTVVPEGLPKRAFEGYLRVSGRGVAPQDLTADRIKKIVDTKPDEFAEMFPLGWQGVTAAGRVEAERRARIRAYAAMDAAVRGVRVGPGGTVADMVKDSPAAEGMLDAFVRGLPLAAPIRFMPDRVAEADVAAPVRDLIKLLRDIRAMAPDDPRWAGSNVDELSVQMKTDRLLATGRGMPPPLEVQSAETLADSPAPLPDWAATVLKAHARARQPEDMENEDRARLLAARSAKAMAMEDLSRQLDAVQLDDGRTVRVRASKDEVFRKDIVTLLSSAAIVESQPVAGSKQWEVSVRLPLVRLWEFSRPRP
jgi:hypothetical protein